MNESETASVLAELVAAYPQQVVTPETLAIYAAHLRPFEAVEVISAARRHVRTSRFFPTVAELVGAVAEAECSAPQPAAAWAEVAGEIRRVGHTGSRQFSHALIRECVDRFGWRRLCETTELSTDRARWIELYTERRRGEIQRRVLAGADLTTAALRGVEPLELKGES